MLQRAICAMYSTCLRFFKDGDAADVRISEVNSVKTRQKVRIRESPSLIGKDEAHRRPDHGMSHPHDVDAADALANVLMNSLEIGEDHFLPVRPVLHQEPSP